MSTNWRKHFYEQVINKGRYDEVDSVILEELFFMLDFLMRETDEEGQLLDDEEAINSYTFVIKDYLTPDHISFLNKLMKDMDEERHELLQKMSPTQTEEGEGKL